jgi:Protein of unknown function (DUF4019)
MAKAIALLVAVLLLGAWPALAQEHGAAVDAAEKSAQAWLVAVDAGKYGKSWDMASAFFQSKVSKAKWESSLQSVRAPLGALQSRKLKSATYTTDLPNVPKGEYVVLQYRTSFANMKSGVETVTPMKETDGTWKVSGYYIRPAD